MVRDTESKVKRYRGSKMMQRWLASALLDCEKRFRRVKGYALIPEVIKNIEAAAEEEADSLVCSSLGLPLIAGLFLMGLCLMNRTEG